ncbi:hypothetical protein FOA52_015908 [Chlamydomonas sp. UWO 241]|nr:hypothetical protein FOA52_015908 [Chlamydomonas sp. UWO 241]
MSLWIISSAENTDTAVKLCECLASSLNFHDYRHVSHEDIMMTVTDGRLGLLVRPPASEDKDQKWVVRPFSPVAPPLLAHFRVGSDMMRADNQITLARQLHFMGARIVNSIESMLSTTNKVWHLQELAAAGIPVPNTATYSDMNIITQVGDRLSYPLVAKSVRGNQGNAVFLIPSAHCHDELKGVLAHDVPYLYQHYIEESRGTDCRVICVGGKAIYTMIRRAAPGAFRANLAQGGHGEIVTGQYPEAERLAERISHILKIDICGVDLLFSGTGFVVCEVNNNPGFSKDVYKHAGIEHFICQHLVTQLSEHPCFVPPAVAAAAEMAAAAAFCASDMEGQGASAHLAHMAPPLMSCVAERLSACSGAELSIQMLVGHPYGGSLQQPQLPMPSGEPPLMGHSCSSEGSAEAACCPDDRMEVTSMPMPMLGATMQQ